MSEEAKHSIQDLNQLFLDGESADQELFAEQRSNVQLIAGEHYAKRSRSSGFIDRVRGAKDISNEQKIRLTKNHIRKIVKTYVNSITSYAPGVTAMPKDKSSMQHQKTAELSNSVWADGKARHDFNSKINQFANDFCGIGEFAAKIFFDPNKGKFLGHEAELDESGQVAMDENGQPVSSGNAKFNGDVIIERMFAFNIIRPSGLKDMSQTPWLCHRKMAAVKEVISLIKSAQGLSPEEKDKLVKKVTETPDQTFVILDGNTGQYKQVKDQTMLKEWFFRPCPEYPMGYFYICTNDDIIFEGELPFGVWPIVFRGFDEIQTSPRSRSIVKQLRPNQIEINRASSKMAEHQITLGDDKILIQNGTKLSPGQAFPGVRSYGYAGSAPIVMAGRTGEQYLAYINSQIVEMYQIAMIEEQKEEKQAGFDVYSQLFRSLKDKKRFSLYTDTFESGLKEIFQIYITLCKNYYGPTHLIPAIGKSEMINIDEFKKVDELCYNVTAEAQTDDAETKLGKQLMLQNIMQYVGPQLAKDDIGKIIRMMPYAQDEAIIEDLTMDFDFATNYMLALDRGKPPVVNPNSNHPYLIKKLINRKSKPDFEFLNPQIKQMYDEAINTHQQLKTEDELKIKQAQSEFIPTGGYLVASDFYVPDPNNPEKLPKRVRLPSEAMDWLIKQLAAQGSDQQTLSSLDEHSQASMSDMFLNKLRMVGGGQGMGPQAAPNQIGQTSPGGFNGR